MTQATLSLNFQFDVDRTVLNVLRQEPPWRACVLFAMIRAKRSFTCTMSQEEFLEVITYIWRPLSTRRTSANHCRRSHSRLSLPSGKIRQVSRLIFTSARARFWSICRHCHPLRPLSFRTEIGDPSGGRRGRHLWRLSPPAASQRRTFRLRSCLGRHCYLR